MADPTNPNDPDFASNPHYVFVNGRWQYRETTGTPPTPTEGNVQASSQGTDFNNFGEGLLRGVEHLINGFGDVARGSSFPPELLGQAPGSDLSTAQSTQDATRLQPFIAALQQQAATGGGAWESALGDATDATKATASALGQSMSPATGYAASLRNIGNAQGAADQRAVGVGNILRAQTQQDATRQLGQIFAGQQGLDASQAAQQAAARQGSRAAQVDLANTQQRNVNNTIQGGTQAFLSLFSNGGQVPGQPKVFGDDSRNDTVPAKLSPKEIVIPISITEGPDPVGEGAAFIAAIKAQGPSGVTNFDDGGMVPPTATNPRGDPSAIPDVTAVPTFMGAKTQNAGILNGGLLETAPYNATRDASMANADMMGVSAMGGGPSVAPQMTRNAQDATIEQALQAGAGGAPPDVLNRVAQAGSQQGANVAATRATEQSRAMGATAQAMQQQRAADQAFALAQQQAAWRNSMMNAGIDLQSMAALRNLLAGAGQAATAAASFDFGGGGDEHGDHGYGSSSHDDYGITGASHDSFADYEGHGEESSSHGGGGSEGASHYFEGGEVDMPSLAELERRKTRTEEMETEDKVKRMGKRIDKRLRDNNHSRNRDLDDLTLSMSSGGEVQKAEAFLRAMRAA